MGSSLATATIENLNLTATGCPLNPPVGTAKWLLSLKGKLFCFHDFFSFSFSTVYKL